MAKRFRDTNLSREAWYRKLPPVYKCVWNFLCDECDVAGIWSIDHDALEFSVGGDVDLGKFMEAVNNGKIRIEKLGDDKIFITGFIEFQYGELSENCKPHQKILSILKKYELFERVCKPYPKGINTLQEKDKEEDKEKEVEVEKSAKKEKSKRRTALVQVSSNDESPEHRAEYQRIVEEITDKQLDIRTSWLKIKEFIETRNPLFPSPYVDLWNIFAGKNSLSKVDILTSKRKDKFRIRVREPSFDFIKILEAIGKNDFYLGRGNGDWKVDFDFIIHSEDNYIKILERKIT